MDTNVLIDNFVETVAYLEDADANEAALIVICRCAERIGITFGLEHAESVATILSTCVRDVLLASIVEQPEQKTNIVPFTRRS